MTGPEQITDYHSIRARELGMPKGTGKRYSREELEAFLATSKKEYKKVLEKALAEDRIKAYLEIQKNYCIYKDPFSAQGLNQLWAEAIEHGLVTTPERLFYMAVDILRIRLQLQKRDLSSSATEKLIATDRFNNSDCPIIFSRNKDEWARQGFPPSTYTLHFYQPALVSPSDFLSITVQGEALPDETIEIVRTPASHEWSGEKNRFYNQEFVFGLGNPITIHHRSRFYDEIPNGFSLSDFGIQLHSVHLLSLNSQQMNTFGRRLWQVHLNTPSTDQNESA